MTLLAQFFLAWIVGVPAMVLAAVVDSRISAAFLATGLLLIGGAARALVSDRDWERFAESQRARPGGGAFSAGRSGRHVFAATMALIGAGFALGGVLGVLEILGR